MNSKDKQVLKVAQEYVQGLRETGRVELWRDYWKKEGQVLQQRKGQNGKVQSR